LKLWQQNLDKGLGNQHELLQRMGSGEYQFVALQEPYIDFRDKTRANSHWSVVYPTGHGRKGARTTRAVTLVSTELPTGSWSQMDIDSSDIVVVEFRCAIGVVRIVNIYNDGDHDENLVALRNYMQRARLRPARGRVFYLWVGDFNRHSPMWDEFRNAHLFTAQAEDAVFMLLHLLGTYRMEMALLRDIPTLKAKGTGNFTRPDNVFCTSN
ncbi:Endonuclease/exonuclease/phosphatase, partial [Mycena metata]